ncbi:hypothetical protein POJ06DRAFT_245037 [Lipomyces tetrasporus]|uniref:Uncharacterized protein n=1 Tax=Lipomyces tetrasporus TaxID=54092 RepID=A0AAD7QW68_9ASCO|nr:uncharacterized protein POJ06DRAFT_245037 [Lipomyces tetrasporus]KAJ8102568.1 hypothetical protein POJ06DRAFT_245037 [Lipomyces tetrasporus]
MPKNWLFEADEATIDQTLLEAGIDLSIDLLPESPAVSAWALKALPTVFTGTPLPSLKAIEGSIHQQRLDEQMHDLDNDVVMRDVTQESIRPEPASTVEQLIRQPPKGGPADSLRARLLRKQASAAALSKVGKENADPASFIQQPASFKQSGPAARDLQIPTIDTPTRRPAAKDPPVSILRTPGAASAKKVVSFTSAQNMSSNTYHDHGDNYKPTARIRSGLPTNFPGKFPSPFTPKTSVIDRLDLAETPATSSARWRELAKSRLSSEVRRSELMVDDHTKQEIVVEQSKFSNNSSRKSEDEGDSENQSNKPDRRRHSKSAIKKLRFVCDQVSENNQNLEKLVAQKTLSYIRAGDDSCRRSTRFAQSATVADAADPLYWKRRFEETEEERLQLLAMLEEVQKHSEYLTEFGQEQDRRIIDLQRQLDEESRKGKETVLMVQALSREMKSLKDKSAEVNRMRLKQLAENRKVKFSG